jgi:hypothetical protein
MELATIALVVTGILGVAASFVFYKVGKDKVMIKVRQAKDVMDAFTEMIKDDKVQKEELEKIWKEIQELLGLKEEKPV